MRAAITFYRQDELHPPLNPGMFNPVLSLPKALMEKKPPRSFLEHAAQQQGVDRGAGAAIVIAPPTRLDEAQLLVELARGEIVGGHLQSDRACAAAAGACEEMLDEPARNALPTHAGRGAEGEDLRLAGEDEIENEAQRLARVRFLEEMAARASDRQELGDRSLVPAIVGEASAVKRGKRGEVVVGDCPKPTLHRSLVL